MVVPPSGFYGNLKMKKKLVAPSVLKSAVSSTTTSCIGEWLFTVIVFRYFAMVEPPSGFYGNLKTKIG